MQLFVGGIIFLALFVVTSALVFSDVTQNWDAATAVQINTANASMVFINLMVFLSLYGREWFWIPLVGVMIVLGSRETKILAAELAILFVAGIVIGDTLKIILVRPRPFETVAGIITRVPTAGDTNSSYPSGHALIVSIGAVFSLVKFKVKWVAVLLSLEAALVCNSRVFVGVHYPMDVLGGIFAGATIVFLGVFLIEKYGRHWLEMIGYVFWKITGNGPLKL
jgi:undecaprenyl-diphosphatase